MEDKVKCKLFFSDLDHTLVVDDHIPTFNLEAINQAKEKGVKFVICTGRPYNFMSHLLKELNTENLENEYTVCSSGAVIYENKNQKIIYFKGVEYETTKLVFEYAKKFKDVLILFDTFDLAYVLNEEMIEKEKWKDLKYKVLKNIEELQNCKVIRIIFFTKDYNYTFEIQNEIKKDKTFEGKITTFMTGPFLEINTFGVCKGEALKWLSNYLNIDVKETIAIGDDFNDESMIKEAGLGCCVKSAKDNIKKISKYVCNKDFFEGSVKEVIDKFILNKDSLFDI